MRIDMSGNGTDACRTYMWVDPNPAGGDPDTGVAIVKRNSTVPAGGIDHIAMEYGGDGVNGRLVFDEINLATSFSELSLPTDIEPTKNVPLQFGLAQNYPNPFNPSTMIQYMLPTAGMTTLKVYNLLGQEVATLVNEMQAPGAYTVRFNASSLSSGLYFVRIQSGSFSAVKKMVLLK
jgi:hypothetical protein